jgi:hypothetical protein
MFGVSIETAATGRPARVFADDGGGWDDRDESGIVLLAWAEVSQQFTHLIVVLGQAS